MCKTDTYKYRIDNKNTMEYNVDVDALRDEYLNWLCINMIIHELYSQMDKNLHHVARNVLCSFQLNRYNGMENIVYNKDLSVHANNYLRECGFDITMSYRDVSEDRIPDIVKVYVYGGFVRIVYGKFKFKLPTSRWNFYTSKTSITNIIKMLLRYDALLCYNGNFWSLCDELWNQHIRENGCTIECFACPINNRLDTFCSLFYDIDNYFGSIGDFFTAIESFGDGSYCVNPPFTIKILDKSVDVVMNLLERTKSTVVMFIPAWDDADFIARLKSSQYLVSCTRLEAGKFMMKDLLKNKEFPSRANCYVVVLSSNNFPDQLKV